MPRSDRQFHSTDLSEALATAALRTRRGAADGLRLRVGQAWYPILGIDETGFDLDRAAAPRLRGLVEIHDAGGLVRTGLVVAADPSDDVMHYDFKWVADARTAPPRDYVAAEPWDAATA
jgi:hypothetical protein